MECLDANVVQDLMSGALDSTTRAGVLGHLDTCEDCRELLGITARDSLRDHFKHAAPYPEELAADARKLAAKALADGTDAKVLAGGTDPSVIAGDTSAVALEDTRIPAPTPTLESTRDSDPALAETTLPVTPGTARVRTEPPTQGKRLGRYTLVERLGAGAMGIVWRAEDPTLGRNIAVKQLRRQDEALTDRLVREAQSMAQVNHPNVVTVYEVGQGHDGTTFIAMELVTGQSLRAWQTKGRRTIDELVNAYIAAARGLAAAHGAGIIHRDFKPDNVLVGEDGRVRVTDFGLAAAKPVAGATQQISDVNLTTSGSVLGTPAYMAPEQFTGGNVDPRTDQFNFCVALYEALYGERPFAGKTFNELGDNVCDGRLKPPSSGSRISGALRAIVLRGLSVKPGDRFATMDDLIRELGRDRARPWRRTAIVSAALAAALALGLVADRVVRDRVAGEIHQSFALTGMALDRAVDRLTESFYVSSGVAYREPALREVAGHHDQADFGLGSSEDDRSELERIHNTLVSTEWLHYGGSQLAIADYKGRLLFTSAEPGQWGADLKLLPAVKRALDAGKGDSVSVLPYSHPGIATTGILGKQPKDGLVVLFERTVALGDKASGDSEARALYLQLQDGRLLLENVRLDKQTLLALVDKSGTAINDAGMSEELVRAAPPTGEIAEVSANGETYLVQSRRVPGLDRNETIANVVMARPLGGVLSLFPGARLVFALAALVAIGLGVVAFLRARQIASARV